MLFSLLDVGAAIGRFHPALVHLPIGVLFIGLLLYLLADHPRFGIPKAALQLVLLIGIGTALLSAITGFLLSNAGDYPSGNLALHMWLAILTIFCALLFFARMVQPKKDPLTRYLAFLLLLLLVAAAHFGGRLTHGADYPFADKAAVIGK